MSNCMRLPSSSDPWTVTLDDPVLRKPEDHADLDRILSAVSPAPSIKGNEFCHAILDHPTPPLYQCTSQDTVKVKIAAVMVLITFDKTTGDPLVTLTTRSMKLRSHPGDTALPGGKQDSTDVSLEATALREAYEEIGLDPSSENVTFLGRFQPYPSSTFIEVHPCVFLWTGSNPPVFKINKDEVDAIFYANMRLFLSPKVQVELDPPHPKPDNNNNYNEHDTKRVVVYDHSYNDLLWISDRMYRLHIFQHADFASDITGLTAEMLIDIALTGFKIAAHNLAYIRNADDQISPAEMLNLIRTGKAKQRTRRSAATRS